MTFFSHSSSLPSAPFTTSTLRLTHLAVEKVLDSMQQSVHRIDEYITSEINKCGGATSNLVTPISPIVTTPGTRGSMSSGLDADIESLGSSRPTTPIKLTSRKMVPNKFALCPHVGPNALKKSAQDTIKVRNYLLETLRKELHPFLLKHVIFRAINERVVQLVRLAMHDQVQILDFRVLDYWLYRPNPSQQTVVTTASSSGWDKSSTLETINPNISVANLPSTNSSFATWTDSLDDVNSTTSSNVKSFNFPPDFFTPPNEFDWFSRDRMGKIVSLPEACELFSIIKMSDCAKQLREVYINAKRAHYFASSLEALSIVSDALSDMKFLTVLVLRGMCDDDILKTIGQNMHQVEHLDVSGSMFVTDVGIQNLFFQEQTQNSALYLISAWIVKNMHKMNPCVHTLIHLDYSWTSVTSVGRKMVQLIPGSYLFKRLKTGRGANDGFGHHIFIRESPCLHDLIPSKGDSAQCKIFEKHLVQHVGTRGVKSFLKLIEYHPWRNCVINVYALENTDVLTNMTSAFGIIPRNKNSTKKESKYCFGIITPNHSEKRIQGIVYWSNGLLTQVYTIYPFNVNTLGMLSHLRLFRGVVNEVWRMQTSLLPDLVHLDIFTEPITFINIIESCPNLRRLHVRIRRIKISDDELIRAIENSMCRRTLEDIWIGPGKLAESNTDNVRIGSATDEDKPIKGVDSTSTKGYNASNVSSLNSFVHPASSKDKIPVGSASSSSSIEPIQLSLECVDAIIGACPKLKRLGDLSTWAEVEAEELWLYCEQLKRKNSCIFIIWANHDLQISGAGLP